MNERDEIIGMMQQWVKRYPEEILVLRKAVVECDCGKGDLCIPAIMLAMYEGRATTEQCYFYVIGELVDAMHKREVTRLLQDIAFIQSSAVPPRGVGH